MTTPVILLLLAGLDAVPAAVVDGWLAAAETAYTHVEAECRFITGRPGGPAYTVNEVYVGSWGQGHALLSTAPGNTDRLRPTVWVVNPAYSATATKQPHGGWLATPGQPVRFRCVTLHPQAPCGPPESSISYRDLLRGRVGPLAVAVTDRAGRPAWAVTAPLTKVGLYGHSRLLTLTLAAGPPVLVLVARTDTPAIPDYMADECEVRYAPAAAGDWPAVRAVRVVAGGVERTAEFTRYTRLAAPPASDRLTLAAVGLPPPVMVGSAAEPLLGGPQARAVAEDDPGDGADGRWQWWAIGGILLVGAVAFVRAGRRPG